MKEGYMPSDGIFIDIKPMHERMRYYGVEGVPGGTPQHKKGGVIKKANGGMEFTFPGDKYSLAKRVFPNNPIEGFVKDNPDLRFNYDPVTNTYKKLYIPGSDPDAAKEAQDRLAAANARLQTRLNAQNKGVGDGGESVRQKLPFSDALLGIGDFIASDLANKHYNQKMKEAI